MSGAGSYWEKINVPPINWVNGAKWIKQGDDSRDPGLYQIDLPGIVLMDLQMPKASSKTHPTERSQTRVHAVHTYN